MTVADNGVGIAHEFNNALMALMGNVELFEMDFSEDEGIKRCIVCAGAKTPEEMSGILYADVKPMKRRHDHESKEN